MKNPFPMSNYPPGVTESSPDAPWNEKSTATCYGCWMVIELCDMSGEEYRSFEDNGDGEFLCNTCWTPEDGDS
jgi:hypothetical protein